MYNKHQIECLRSAAKDFAPDNNVAVEMLCDTALALLTKVEQLQLELHREENAPCCVCAGDRKLLTGEPCTICSETGLESQEHQGLRRECFRLRRELGESQARLEPHAFRRAAFELVERELRELKTDRVRFLFWDRGASETLTVEAGQWAGHGTLQQAADELHEIKARTSGEWP